MLHLDVDDAHDLLTAEAVEGDDLIEAIEKLRLERGVKQPVDLIAHRGEILSLENDVASDVTRHDDDGVSEVHHATLPVGEPPLVEKLKQHVEHVGMRLFDLVEEDDRVRPPANDLGELPALLVADVARRCADEPRDGELLHVLAHVDARKRLLVVEEKVGERLGKLGLPHARRADEHEGGSGPVDVGQAALVPPDGVGHRGNRMSLPHDPLLENRLEAQKLLHVRGEHLAHRDTRPGRHHARDVLLRYFLAQEGFLALEGLEFCCRRRKLLLGLRDEPVLDLGGLGEVALALVALLVGGVALELGFELADALDDVLLVLPLQMLGVAVCLQVGKLPLDLLEALT